MGSTGTSSLLAGLVQGFAGARAQQAHTDLATRVQQQQQMLAYFHAMANNPNVPPEHQQWAMDQGLQLAQHDVSKPFPKGLGDLSKLPPVNIQQAPKQAVSQAPAMTLAMPQPPGGGQAQAPPTTPTTPTAPQAPNGNQVGRSPNGTVNAIGQAKQLEMPTPPPNLAAGAPSSVNIPAGAPTTIQNPQPPVQIAPGGTPHVLTPSDRTQYALAAQQQEMNALQQQYPTKSPEELAYFSQHGEFPKPDEFSLEPGQERFRDGKLIARNEMPKPGAKSGYEFDPATGGVKDLARGGAILTPKEVAAIPEAKSVQEQGVKEQERKEKQQEAKEDRQHTFELNKLTQTFANALQTNDINEAKKAAGEGRKAYNDLNKQYLADQQRYNAMSTLYDDIQRNPTGDVGSFDAALLAFHMGMTVGAVKGMRTGKDMVLFHEKARSLPAGMQTTIEGWVRGDQLSPEQRQNFVELAHEKMAQEKDQVEAAKGNYDTTFQEYQGRINEASRGRIKPKGTPGIQKPPAGAGAGTTPSQAGGLPAQALARLQEGHNTTFANGQVWTLRGGQPVQVSGPK